MKKRLNDTEKTSCRIRSHVVDMSYRSKTAEIGSALCISDILTVLYFNILNINPKKPKDEKRDYFVLSKGHGAAALYATLAERGFFPTNKLEKYRVNDGIFHGHPSRGSAPGIEVSTGSLGHGLSIGTGIALTLKKENPKVRVFVLVGDGECNEGSIWEATMFASTHKLNNLVAVIDDNGFQGFGKTREIHKMNLEQKFKSFGWKVLKTDGHNHSQLKKTLTEARNQSKPTVVIAKTIAGKGIPHIEHTLLAHYYVVDEKTHKNHYAK
ncbi:MAG: hypothetical protein A2566_02245 [Candidatus Zambryskibacteria bacterium RIFOXYD1_FULL_40_13]|nr:MAG: transketolase [Parcubacteria group bacterium GW2011_GWC1_39_12]KKR19034.1 MAG: transketolase [Parcubacteria group bacterium GW2011_GWF1_39_37]KKR35601.1 MAG: transketolase [Parcubacteria group bacterium GW2011_GWC2_40_10]KKR52012.1 MAG: transketolase [Parcubacteria group bacterium GW2011_GWE1_40_20]KKR66014.1 MAG: transketolase [Parcubacteria group bacterium GW2011_GWB1_40_5]KKR68796.1 MAG: transketolase [Parcubacteria group bacterium GW2011_GWF2_40_69]KKR81953.1 MAG: transketolase [P